MNTGTSNGWKYGLDRPSGAVLPLILRKKLQEQEQQTEEEASVTLVSPPSQSAAADAVFSAPDLEERLRRASVTMIDIQKQLARGEEAYFEETNAHGNLYRGWDAFVDAKDVGGSGGSSGAPPNNTGGGNRRIPADNRWFSGSCQSVSRHARPAPLYTSATSKPSSVVSSTTPTPSLSVHSDSVNSFPTSERQSDGGARQQVISTAMKAEPKVDSMHSTAETPTAEAQEANPDNASKTVNWGTEKSKETSNEHIDATDGVGKIENPSEKEIEKSKDVGETVSEERTTATTKTDPPPEVPPSRRKTRKRKAGES